MSRYLWKKFGAGEVTLPLVLQSQAAVRPLTSSAPQPSIQQTQDPSEYQKGFDQGLEEGKQAGLDEMRAQSEQLCADLRAAMTQLVQLRDELNAELLDRLMEATPQLFRILFECELSCSSDVLSQIIRQVVPDTKTPVTVSVTPEVAERLSMSSSQDAVKIVACDTLRRGEVRVATDDLLVSVSVPENLAHLLRHYPNVAAQEKL